MKRKGFTLIEVIVVIALIGVLTSFLVPSFEKSGERAKNTKLASDLKVLDSGISLYKLDNGNLPATLDKLDPEYVAGSSEFKDAQNNMLSYVANVDGTYQLKGKNSKGDYVLSDKSKTL